MFWARLDPIFISDEGLVNPQLLDSSHHDDSLKEDPLAKKDGKGLAANGEGK